MRVKNKFFDLNVRNVKINAFYFNAQRTKVSLWNSERNHTDYDLEPRKYWGINSITKNQFDKLFRRGIDFQSRILSCLSGKHPEKILGPNSNLDNVNGIVLPTKLKIRNNVNNTLKPKKVNSTFSYADLYNWVNEHLSVPEDENEPFVIDADIVANDKVPKTSVFRLARST